LFAVRKRNVSDLLGEDCAFFSAFSGELLPRISNLTKADAAGNVPLKGYSRQAIYWRTVRNSENRQLIAAIALTQYDSE
jgi:hypothetical protein